MISQFHRNQLKDLVRPRTNEAYQGTINVNLDEYIEKLQQECPEYFHKDIASLRSRTFFDEPVRLAGHAPIPMAGFIKPVKGW